MAEVEENNQQKQQQKKRASIEQLALKQIHNIYNMDTWKVFVYVRTTCVSACNWMRQNNIDI